MHKCGYTHNDLKLENVMIEGGKSQEDFSDIVLIDYGYSKSFLDENKNHKVMEEVKYFQGNFMFASKYQLAF